MNKKKSSSKSAFFNPRALLGFALLLIGGGLGLLAQTDLTGQKVASAATKVPVSPAAPQLLQGVKPVKTVPLRYMKAIPPLLAPGHHHIEPTNPEPPSGVFRDKAIQTVEGPVLSAPTATGVAWDGVGVGFAGFSPSSNPPDVEGRVGATQYVQWNNTSFAVFDKSGNLLFGPAAGNTLFQSLGGVCASHNDGDPVVSYDILSGRWIVSQFVVNAPAGSASHQCIAVSQTQDATGAWYLYDFVTDTTNFIDYPHTGVWPDAYYMSGHVFTAGGASFIGARVYAFERAAMIAGQTARMQSANLTPHTSQQFGFLPADLDSLTPPPVGEAEFVLGPDPATNATTDSTRVAVTWGATPTITLTESTIADTTFTTANCVSSGRACVPQSGQASANGLDNIKGHFMYRLAYRNNGTQASPQESILANIAVRGATTAHNAIRWYEFRNSGNSTATPTIFQQSTFDPDTTNYRWLGSMAMDNAGDIALGYSRSSATTFPSIQITGRLVGDTINTMGAEVQVQAGAGSQDSTAGNRWGDYSSMTLDPVDQCTFYYTNEYLKTTGGFNWSTRVASYKFPSCVSAPAWGTLTGTVTSAATGAPISGVNVSLDNGYAGATNASGVYSILVPAASYNAIATDPTRNCATSNPSSAPVSLTVGGTTTQNFTMSGASKLDANAFTINDTPNGNGNGIINKFECFNVNLNVKNDGCATETAISGTVTTSTPGVTIVNGTSAYPDMVIDASANNNVPFQISTSNSFACGTPIVLSLNLTYAGGSKTVTYTLPSCAGGANQAIPSSTVGTTDPGQPDRLGRTGIASTCAGKACPGAINSAGTRNYKTFTFANNSASPACFTATINAALGGGGDIIGAAYQTLYTPPVAQGDAAGNLCLNYLGDTGITGLGTTVGSASFSFSVAANSNFVIVVSTSTGATNSSVFSGVISGFVDQTSGPGPCAANAPVFLSAASQMTQGGAGTYSIPLPSNGTGEEVRDGSGNFTIVMTFDSSITGGSASVTAGTGSVSNVAFSGNNMIVSLSGVTDQQAVTVTATNVTNTSGGTLASASVSLGFLIGDVNGDRVVNVGDTILVRNQSGQPVGSSNFQFDLNADGQINVGDSALVRAKSGDYLP